MIALRQSTASQEVALGPFVDSTDGTTAETALTIANTDIKIWKAGATSLANKNSGGATHMANGIYYATLDATDSNTLGPLVIYIQMSGALAVRHECLVLAANEYDSLIAGTDALEVDTVAINGSTTAATQLAKTANLIISGTVDTVVNTHTPTTTEFQADDITEATTDHYKGRTINFNSGNLNGQSTDITGYTNVGGIGQFTVTALTEAPANDDTFEIV